MGTRALAVLLLAPSLALAQTAGTLTADPTSVGRADCGGAATVTLSWTINTTNTGRSFVAGDKYRVAVYASGTTCPAPTSAPPSGDPTVVVADVLGAGDTDSETVTAAAITTAGQVTCPALTGVGASDVSKVLCVYLVDSTGAVQGTSAAAASGTFTFQLARPPAPVLDSVSPANGALIVYFHEGTAAAPDNATSTSFEIRVYLGTTLVTTLSNAQSGDRVGGLANTDPPTSYNVRVVALSPRGNESAESNTVAGAPLPFVDFWTAYQGAGGREQGGCGGGAGALSLLALLSLALRRRRP